MAARSKQSQAARLARCTRAIAGIQKYLASTPSLVMAAVPYTPLQLESLLGGYGTTLTALSLVHIQLHSAVASEKAQAKQIDELLRELEIYVANAYGARSDQLTEFGFTPKKVPLISAATKAAGIAKAKATRKAKKAALAAVTTASAPPAPAPAAATNGAQAKA